MTADCSKRVSRPATRRRHAKITNADNPTICCAPIWNAPFRRGSFWWQGPLPRYTNRCNQETYDQKNKSRAAEDLHNVSPEETVSTDSPTAAPPFSRFSPLRLPWRFLTAVLILVPPACCQTSSNAPNVPQQDLTQVSMEGLMNIEVTSVSNKEQKLSRTAGAIFVITQEDIRRSGATNIPDLLRMVPGLDVAEINGSTWAIGSRGLNSQFSNKLLVMVDGRSVYSLTFSGVFWDTLDLPLFDIERIEVIRGPGGTIWGANAVTGVISIFTKKAAETNGTIVEAGGGTPNKDLASCSSANPWGAKPISVSTRITSIKTICLI